MAWKFKKRFKNTSKNIIFSFYVIANFICIYSTFKLNIVYFGYLNWVSVTQDKS